MLSEPGIYSPPNGGQVLIQPYGDRGDDEHLGEVEVEECYVDDVGQLESVLKSILIEVHQDLAHVLLDQGRRIEQAVYDQQQMLLDALQRQGHGEDCLALGDKVGGPTPSGNQHDYCSIIAPTEPPLGLPLCEEPLVATGIDCASMANSFNSKSHEVPSAFGIGGLHGDHSSKDKEIELHPKGVSLVKEPASFGSEGAEEPGDRHVRPVSPSDTGRRRGLAAVVSSPWFDYLVASVIMLNATFIFVQADHFARHPEEDQPSVFGHIEIVFFILFAVELLLRVSVWRCRFFRGPDWAWNLFDTVVVVIAGMEEIVKLAARGNNALSTVMAMRIVKLPRMVQIIRLVKLFRELRILMMSIFSTLWTLFWSIICLFLIIFMFGVYIANVIADYQAEAGKDPDMTKYFGSMPDVMLSLFQATTGGLDWRELSNLILRASKFGFVVFLGYISMMVYAIMNVITGVCINNVNKAAEDEFDNSVHEELSKPDPVVATLRKLLRSGHGDDKRACDTITWPELEQHLTDPKVGGYFKRIELEPWHLRSFFDRLKVFGEDEEPRVAIDHFIRGCMRLRCNIKNSDLMASRHEIEEVIVTHISELKHAVDKLLAAESHNTGPAVDVK